MLGADILLHCLELHGVDTVFGLPGGVVIPLYDRLKEFPNIHHVLVRHEQGAAHAADGYSRATGKVGVVIATSGPGATNLVTGIATAYLDSIPMVAITGQVPTSLIGKDSFQEVAVVNYPNDPYFTRITEFKKLTWQDVEGKTAIMREYPGFNGEKCYPYPTQEYLDKFKLYEAEMKKEENVIFAGRLAKYKYYNMDVLVAEILNMEDFK